MDESPSNSRPHRLDRRAFLATGAAVGVAGCTDVLGDDEAEIADWHDLAAVREDLDGEYALVTDLDARTGGYDEHVGDPARGWAPIGEDDSGGATEFTGTFDGRGNEIADLRIDRPETDSVGLFGVSEGTIENVRLADPEITGTGGVGGLVGEISGGSVSESVVRGGVVAGEEVVGGLVGITTRGDVSRSAVRGGTVAGGEAVGGLVGDVVNRSEASASFVRGTTVTGETAVGGFAGRNRFRSEVRGSWAAGEVTGDAHAGGFLGTQDRATTAGYWDTERTDQAAGIGNGAGDVVGLTTAEMQGEAAAERMDRLDFADTWAVRTDPEDYPVLR